MTNSRSRSRRPAFTITFVEDRGAAAQFKELTLPLLGDVYTLARYLLDSAADADDAVQECYLRALGPGYARNRIAARARRSNNPPARCGASDETPGGDRAARNQ